MSLREWVVSAPSRSDHVARWAMAVAAVAGALGGLAGLVIGLVAYPPTAWFAVLELGVPAALVGAALGAAIGGVRSARRRF